MSLPHSWIGRLPSLRRLLISAVLLFLAVAFQSPSVADPPVWPTDGWPTATPEAMAMDAGLLAQGQAYAQNFGGTGLVVRHGHVVAAWGDTNLRYDLKSTTKSIGTTALGLALADGLLTLADRAGTHLPDSARRRAPMLRPAGWTTSLCCSSQPTPRDSQRPAGTSSFSASPARPGSTPTADSTGLPTCSRRDLART